MDGKWKLLPMTVFLRAPTEPRTLGETSSKAVTGKPQIAKRSAKVGILPRGGSDPFTPDFWLRKPEVGNAGHLRANGATHLWPLMWRPHCPLYAELLGEGVKGGRTRLHDRSWVHVQQETILYMDLALELASGL